MSGTAKSGRRTAAEILSLAPEADPAKAPLPPGYREALDTLSWLERDLRYGHRIPPSTMKAISAYRRWRDRQVRKLSLKSTVDLFVAMGHPKTLTPGHGKVGAFEAVAAWEFRVKGIRVSAEHIRKSYYPSSHARARLPRKSKVR